MEEGILIKMRLAGTQRVTDGLKILLFCLTVCVPALWAQEPRAQQPTAPPPLKIIAHEDRAQIDQAKDPKARVRIILELADSHLTGAEEHTAQHEFESASAELGKYEALIEEALAFLSPMSHNANKTRDLYKRVELALRAQGPRLTSMRRITPLEYAVWIKEAEDFARKGRTEALNSFYGHTVVRDAQQKPANESRPRKQSKDGSTAPQTDHL